MKDVSLIDKTRGSNEQETATNAEVVPVTSALRHIAFAQMFLTILYYEFEMIEIVPRVSHDYKEYGHYICIISGAQKRAWPPPRFRT